MRTIAGIPFYPVLFVGLVVLSAMTETGTHVHATLRVWAIAMAISLGVLALWFAATRRAGVAGFGAFATLWLLVSRDLDRIWLGLISVAVGIAVLVVIRRMAGGRIPWSKVTETLNLIGLLILVLALLRGVGNGTIPAVIEDLTATREDLSANTGGAGRPDIYIVLLDGYPRSDVLADVSGMDNRPFLDALSERGFEVAARSRSSYMYTDLTLTTLLHGRHLADIPEIRSRLGESDRPSLVRQVLNEAPLVERLRAAGYLVIANAQAWDEPALRNVDLYVEGRGLNEFERFIWGLTIPGALQERFDQAIYQDAIEPWVEDAFDAFEYAAGVDTDRPRFAFIHVPSPHFPIIFNADGSRADAAFGRHHPDHVPAPELSTRAAYAGQIAYLNDRVLQLLDETPVPEDAVVILMSDHGPEFGLNWTDGSSSDLTTRFGAFFAARAPDGTFSDDMNTSAALLALLRSMDLTDAPALEGRYFVSNALGKLASLAEVSDPWAAR